jgi:hypothetical protein
LEEVQRFEFKTSRGEQINFSRRDNGWSLSGESETESIDSFKVSEFWKNLAAKKIESFLDDPSAELRRALSLEHGGTRSLGSLRQISRDGKEKAWHFFDNNSVVYAKIPGSAGYVTLDKSIEDVLKWSKVDFYDRSVFRRSFGALSYVKSQENTFEKKSDRWLDRKGKAADQVQLLISELEFLKYESVFSEADSIKLGQLLQKVELGFKDISPTVLEFFEQEGSQDYIFLKTENRIFIVKRAVLDNINAKIGIVEKEKISESK